VEELQAQLRPFELGLGLGRVVAGRLGVALGPRAVLEEVLLPGVFVRRRHAVRPRLEEVRPCGREVRALDDGEGVSGGDALAELAHDLGHASADRRKDVGDTPLVEGHAPRGDEVQREGPHGGRLDDELRTAHLLVGQPDLSRGRRDGRSLAPAARSRERGGEDEAPEYAPHGVARPTAASSSATATRSAYRSCAFSSST